MQRYKVTFPEPKEFDFEHFLTAMGGDAKGFYCSRDGDTLTLRFNDEFGRYENVSSRRCIGSLSSSFNYIEYMKFELDEQDRVTAIMSGHPNIAMEDILFRLAGADRDSQEYKVIYDYTELAREQMYQIVGDAVKQNPVVYKDQVAEDDALVAGVFQNNFVSAHGPQAGINYLGTHGIVDCTGISVVTSVAGEFYPRVSVAHIDIAGNGFDGLLSRMLYTNGHMEGETKVSLLNGCCLGDSFINVIDAFERKGLSPFCDSEIDGSDSKKLIVDLRTGDVVDPSRFGCVSWLTPDKEKRVEMTKRMTFSHLVGEKCLLSHEYDLRKGGPEGYVESVLSKRSGLTSSKIEGGKSFFNYKNVELSLKPN